MKTRLKDIALLDMRKTTEETIANIDKIQDVAVLLVSPDTRAFTSRVQLEDVACVQEVPNDVDLLVQNGRYTLSAGALLQKPSFLLINGQMFIEKDVTAEQITQNIKGGIINGQLIARKVHANAMLAAGVNINGVNVTFPDDAIYRESNAPLTVTEAEALKAPLYLAGKTQIEKGVSAILQQKNLMLYGMSAVMVDESDIGSFYAIWKGTGKVHSVPNDFTVMRGNQDIDRGKALMLRGKRFVLGNVCLRESVQPGDLKALEGLCITGTLTIPMHLLDTVLPLLHNEPELVPYEGTLITIDGSRTISADLDLLPEKIAIFCNGSIKIDADASAEALKQRVTLLHVDGIIHMTKEQQAALLPVMVINGEVLLNVDADEEAKDPDVNIIEDIASYIL